MDDVFVPRNEEEDKLYKILTKEQNYSTREAISFLNYSSRKEKDRILKRKLKIGDYISLNGRKAQIDKILPDGTMYVVTEDVVNTSKGPTNYFRVKKQWVWVTTAQ